MAWTESNRLLRGSGRLFRPEGGEIYHFDEGAIPADHALAQAPAFPGAAQLDFEEGVSGTLPPQEEPIA